MRIYEVKILSFLAANKPKEAKKASLEILSELGVTFPQKPKPFNVVISLLYTKWLLKERKPMDLIHLPELEDPRQLGIMKILSKVSAAISTSNPILWILVALKRIQLSLKYGNTTLSANAYIALAILLCGRLCDIELAYQFSELALALSE